MVNKLMNSAKKELLDEIANSEEIIEFRKIEKAILNDSRLSDKFKELVEAQKQAINAREFGLENAYLMYKKQYEDAMKFLKDDPLFNQYLALKEDAKEVMNLTINIIETEINKKINE